MAVAGLERRTEIGLRRALGADQRAIAAQLLIEAVMLASIGGTLGLASGASITAAWAYYRGWTIALPASSPGNRGRSATWT